MHLGTAMRRRDFINLLGGAAAAWPFAADAQQQNKLPLVGFLYPGSPESRAPLIDAFRKGLSGLGFVQGRTVQLDYQWASDDLNRLPEMAAGLVHRQVSVIVVGTTVAALAAKRATSTIPIVFSIAADPVQFRLVTSLNRPGGNMTGLTIMSTELGSKRLGLLREMLPRANRFGLLVDPKSPAADSIIKNLSSAASSFGSKLEPLAISMSSEIATVFASLGGKDIDALIVSPNPIFVGNQKQIIRLAENYRMPAIYPDRLGAEAGGLMSYGTNTAEQYQQVGIYAGRILKGENPSELPVMQATKFELVVNLRTARMLGLVVPPTLLALADEVIE
jgi:putative ABC transport system substrate-binding protein